MTEIATEATESAAAEDRDVLQAEETEPTDVASQSPDAAEHTEDKRAGQEAARYRRQLREVEAERDELAKRLDTARRREVARLLADGTVDTTTGKRVALAVPESLWLTTSMDRLLDADGNVDSDALADAVLAGIAAGLATAPESPSIPTPLFTDASKSPVNSDAPHALKRALSAR